MSLRWARPHLGTAITRSRSTRTRPRLIAAPVTGDPWAGTLAVHRAIMVS